MGGGRRAAKTRWGSGACRRRAGQAAKASQYSPVATPLAPFSAPLPPLPPLPPPLKPLLLLWEAGSGRTNSALRIELIHSLLTY